MAANPKPTKSAISFERMHALLRPAKTASLAPTRAGASRPIPGISDAGDGSGSPATEQYAQEYLCSFDAAILEAYYGKIIAEIERAGHITEVPRADDVPVQTAWDLGISANGMMADMSEPVAQAYLDALALCETESVCDLMGSRSARSLSATRSTGAGTVMNQPAPLVSAPRPLSREEMRKGQSQDRRLEQSRPREASPAGPDRSREGPGPGSTNWSSRSANQAQGRVGVTGRAICAPARSSSHPIRYF